MAVEFKKHVCFCVNNGTSTSFWHDHWCSQAPLKNSHPELFNITYNREGLVTIYELYDKDSKLLLIDYALLNKNK